MPSKKRSSTRFGEILAKGGFDKSDECFNGHPRLSYVLLEVHSINKSSNKADFAVALCTEGLCAFRNPEPAQVEGSMRHAPYVDRQTLAEFSTRLESSRLADVKRSTPTFSWAKFGTWFQTADVDDGRDFKWQEALEFAPNQPAGN